MKIKCQDCIGKINIQDDASEGDIVQCPDCKRDFEIFRKEGTKIQLMRAESFDLSKSLDLKKKGVSRISWLDDDYK